MKNFITISALIFGMSLFAQVGIGTVTPNTKSMLDVSSTSDGTTYRGLMPPRVPTITNRNSIAPGATDKGLTIFVEEIDCLQIWNGTAWENIHCLNNVAFSGVAQNFDLGNTWGYSSDVAFFNNGINGFYGITDASNSIFSNLTSLTNNFLGIRDLDDTEDGNGTTGLATLTFNSIDVSSALTGVTVAFDYQTYRMDNGDDAFYTIVIDGVPQTPVQFINGSGDSSNSGTISLPIAGGTSTVLLILEFEQDGAADVFGFDNFVINPN